MRELANGSLLLQILIIGAILIATSGCTQTIITPEEVPVIPETPIELCEKSEKQFEFDDIGNDLPDPCKLMLARR